MREGETEIIIESGMDSVNDGLLARVVQKCVLNFPYTI